MNKQRFVLISSLLAIALKQMIFTVLLGIQWFEKQNVEMKNSNLYCTKHITFPVLFLFISGNDNSYGSARQKNDTRRRENKPKAYTEAGKISA